MSHSELFFLIFEVLGGLALFILGMGIMSEGLRTAAGSGLRTLLTKTTANRFAGLALGTLLGFLVHSSAASVMFVGFINAGLMNLAQSVAPMLGTNLGTSLSMQLVSFKLTDYAYVGIVVGLALQMAFPRPRVKCLGKALVGFGLLFLGMKVMSGAVAPHRDLLRQYLAGIDGHAHGQGCRETSDRPYRPRPDRLAEVGGDDRVRPTGRLRAPAGPAARRAKGASANRSRCSPRRSRL
ncbi:MAG: hypothetical protein EOM10_09310 [Opitutae bacterium]|nr:hypothetical protein [Opitutae bacterium]